MRNAGFSRPAPLSNTGNVTSAFTSAVPRMICTHASIKSLNFLLKRSSRRLSRKSTAALRACLGPIHIRDTSDDPEDEMTEPEELATAIVFHLKNALTEIETYSEELATQVEEVA